MDGFFAHVRRAYSALSELARTISAAERFRLTCDDKITLDIKIETAQSMEKTLSSLTMFHTFDGVGHMTSKDAD